MKTTENVIIRPLLPDEIPLLRHFLHLAIYLPPGAHPLPESVVDEPGVALYIRGFGGQKHDAAFVAECGGSVVAAVWVRVLAGQNGEARGYGNIDEHTPEYALAAEPAFRNRGIGGALLRQMEQHLRGQGHKQASLSVHHGNPAIRLYRRAGFVPLEERGEDTLMLLTL